jgi:hypothetical protein
MLPVPPPGTTRSPTGSSSDLGRPTMEHERPTSPMGKGPGTDRCLLLLPLTLPLPLVPRNARGGCQSSLRSFSETRVAEPVIAEEHATCRRQTPLPMVQRASRLLPWLLRGAVPARCPAVVQWASCPLSGCPRAGWKPTPPPGGEPERRRDERRTRRTADAPEKQPRQRCFSPFPECPHHPASSCHPDAARSAIPPRRDGHLLPC